MSTPDTTTTALPLAPGRWVADPLHSSVTFSIRHLGLAKVRGRFTRFDAALEVGSGPGDTSVTATIELASIDTGNADRDAHVLAPDLLDAEQNPLLAFASDAITGAGDDWEMTGTLTVAGVSRPVTFAVEFNGTGEMAGAVRAGFGTTGQISRKDFGISFEAPGADAMLGDVIRFELDLELFAPGN